MKPAINPADGFSSSSSSQVSLKALNINLPKYFDLGNAINGLAFVRLFKWSEKNNVSVDGISNMMFIS